MRRTALGRLAFSSLALAALALAEPAVAQGYPPYPPYPQAYRPTLAGALKVSVDVPSGRAFSGQPMDDLFGPQIGIGGELGVRLNPQFMVGGYLGVALGSTGDAFDATCGGYDCNSATFRIGLMMQYHLQPWAPVSPWIGYGFGFTASAVSGDDAVGDFNESYAGIDLAHLMAGIDFRPAGRVGFGFYMDYTVGVYTAYEQEVDGVTVADGTIDDTTVHHWFSFGPRISF